MAAGYLADRVGMTTATTGTGTVTLGSAITDSTNGDYFTFAESGVVNGLVVPYLIVDGHNFEVGLGTYSSTGPTLARTTIGASKIAGVAGSTALTLSGSAKVYLVISARQGVSLANNAIVFDTAGVLTLNGAASAFNYSYFVNPATGFQNALVWQIGGVGNKWIMGLDTDDGFILYDAANSRNVMRFLPNSGIIAARAVRVITAAGAVTVAVTDDMIILNKTVAATTTVNLPATPGTGFHVTIKDGKGDAGTNNITIDGSGSDAIDGSLTTLINWNYGSLDFVWNGTQWNVL